MPGAQVIAQHMVHGALLADDVMSADARAGHGECLQCLIAAVLGRVVYDDEVGLSHVKVGSACPVRSSIQAVLRPGTQDACILPGLPAVAAVGLAVGMRVT